MLDKFKGCLVGLACGDYLGMPVEFTFGRKDVIDFFGSEILNPVDFIEPNCARRTAGYYTDDTCMALCLADSLLECDFDTRDQFLKYKKWLFEGYNTPFGDRQFGVGDHTYKILTVLREDNLPDVLNHVESHGGNGALMRCAPVGLLYHDDIAMLKDYSIKSAIITHNNTEAAWSCVVLNTFIAYSLLGIDKADFVDRFINDHPDCPEHIKKLLLTDFQSLPAKHKMNTSGYTIHTLNVVLYSFFKAQDFREAVTEAVFMGGDADTQGAIVGALAGAYYGFESIPSNWRATLLNKEHIEEVAVNLYNKKISS
ncbi:MAG: ADP-ribosylglycohydrolase family protein [Candidatus Falkowbacteria bacterium]